MREPAKAKPGGNKAVAGATRPLLVGLIALSVIGLGVSTYLWIAKTGAIELVCGTVGDCITVNFSEYSEIAGIPVAAAGAGMYLVLTGLGIGALYGYEAQVATVAFGLALAGALFSLYLTAIEAFVLHEYCVWCLISWVIISVTAVLWGRRMTALSRIDGDEVPERA